MNMSEKKKKYRSRNPIQMPSMAQSPRMTRKPIFWAPPSTPMDFAL
jgi:hypothetical protein